ncbi:Protein RER1 [Psidium guajava]|nr:Protein RER1 [Psidium guajava]
MSGRTYVVIFFFWALLTIITPTLVHLSESSKLKRSLDDENIDSEALRARKAFGFLKKPLASRPLDTERTKAPVPAPSPSPSPEPQPASSRVDRNRAQ